MTGFHAVQALAFIYSAYFLSFNEENNFGFAKSRGNQIRQGKRSLTTEERERETLKR